MLRPYGAAMLAVAKLRLGQEAYYFEVVASSPSARGRFREAEGSWLGAGVQALQLGDRPVDDTALRQLFEGVDPGSGRMLRRRRSSHPVAAFDLTFNVPKSVSLLYALGEKTMSEQIARAHERSVAAAFAYLERAPKVQRQHDRVRRIIPAHGLIAAGFLHRTSRAPDPHLHTHVVLANLGADPDNVWSTLDGRTLYHEFATIGALHDAQLRYELTTRLGMCWQVPKRGLSDLVGVPRSVIRAFSRRQEEIEHELAKTNRSGWGARLIAAESTRARRDLRSTYEEFVAQWSDRALRLGFSADRVAQWSSDVVRPLDRDERSDHLQRVIAAALDSFDGTFDRPALLRAVASRCAEGARVAELEEAVDRALRAPEVNARVEPQRELAGKSAVTFRTSAFEAQKRDLDATMRAAQLVGGGRDLSFLRRDDRVPGEGALYFLAPGDYDAQLDELRAIAISVGYAGRRVIGFSSSLGTAGQFESLTGIPTILRDRSDLTTARAVVFIENPDQGSPRSLAALLERTRRLDCSVVLVRDAVFPKRDPRTVRPEVPLGAGGDVTLVVGAVRVAMCERLARAIFVADSLCQAAGDRAVVVTATARAATLVAQRAVTTTNLGELLAQDPSAPLIVLGGARILGGYLGRITDAQRAHVVVASGSCEATPYPFAAEVAESAMHRRVLGRLPLEPDARRAWRAGVEELRQRAELDEAVALVRSRAVDPTRELRRIENDRALIYA